MSIGSVTPEIHHKYPSNVSRENAIINMIHETKRLQESLIGIEKMYPKKIYEVTYKEELATFLLIPSRWGKDSVTCNILACSFDINAELFAFYYDDLENKHIVKEVSQEDLPLYVSYPFKGRKFDRLLKGRK